MPAYCPKCGSGITTPTRGGNHKCGHCATVFKLGAAEDPPKPVR